MLTYHPPLRDIQFVIDEWLEAPADWCVMPPFRELDSATVRQIAEEAGRFASEVLLPLNSPADIEGCHFDNGAVRTPAGFARAYRHYIDAGWPTLSCTAEDGGQGLPFLFTAVVYEILNATCHGWTMYPGLAQGAYECVRAHRSPDLRRVFLPKLVSGEWLATRAITEAHAGSDVGLIRTRADAALDRYDTAYRITGSKIFISGGARDLTENIVHPLIQRSPLEQRAVVEGERALGYWIAHLIDRAEHHPNIDHRAESDRLVAFLTHIAKSMFTQNGFEQASNALQIYGGHGYIHETGIEQVVRDARVAMLYEGTNEIQAIDLITRKVLADEGAALRALADLMGAEVALSDPLDHAATGRRLQTLIARWVEAGNLVSAASRTDRVIAFSVAGDFLVASGLIVLGYVWAKSYQLAFNRRGADPFYQQKLETANFFFDYLLPLADLKLQLVALGTHRPPTRHAE